MTEGPVDVAPERYGAAMVPRFGPMYRAIGFGQGLDHVRLEDHGVEVIREAAARGPVIYVLPRCSNLDHLALNAALAHRGLPLSAWAPGIGTRRWLPIGDWWRSIVGRVGELFRGQSPPDPVGSGWIARALRAGLALTWFVEDRPG
jgi:glycerol-3-phosphate O-acyltransferase